MLKWLLLLFSNLYKLNTGLFLGLGFPVLFFLNV